jgi:hypothetical protein
MVTGVATAKCHHCGEPLRPRSILCPACGMVHEKQDVPGTRTSGIRSKNASSATGDATGRVPARETVAPRTKNDEEYFGSPAGLLDNIFTGVIHSESIASNADYRKTVADTQHFFDSEDREFNAFATHRRIRTMSGPLLRPPAIVIKNGYVFWSRVSASAFGAAMAHGANSSDLRAKVARLAERLRRESALSARIQRAWHEWLNLEDRSNHAHLSFSDFLRTRTDVQPVIDRIDAGRRALVQECEIWTSGDQARQNADAIVDGMLAAVVAHELGHVCLRHTLIDAPIPLEIYRNLERQADSFAANVLASRESRPHRFIGAALGELLSAWGNRLYDGSGSHPRAAERLENMVRGSESAVRAAESACGISAAEWLELLPSGV